MRSGDGGTAAASEGAALGRRHRPDYWLLVLTVMLLVIGLIVIFSISTALSAVAHVSGNYYVTRQLIAIALGLVAFAVAANVPIDIWRRLARPLLIVAAAATLLAIVMPVNPNYPAHRWVRLGAFSFQSVELLKFAILVWLAGLLAAAVQQGTIGNLRLILKPVGIAMLVTGAVVAGVQSDLGSMGVIVAITGVMLFVAGLPMKWLVLAVLGALLLAGLLVAATPYRRARLEAYLNPSANCQASAYQACQAQIAVGTGGMFGLGLGSGVQAYGYLPEAANDSIFAIYAEKFGFIGAALLLALFVALFARLKHIAERAPDVFSQLLVVGVMSWLSVQSLINIGAMIGVLPLKGITLPFVSYGGTSVIFALAAIGLAFQVSRYTSYARLSKQPKQGGTYDDSADRRRIRGAYHPDLGGR
ncbi:MAG TPA: putative peptidoglycan glycosyltransferase FtsW [Candidatus Saccharimonadales bacterium]|nr:putative peptidoglycan glycosyltransferase FtsW [Candidatus Saccharimonadales bacterium]